MEPCFKNIFLPNLLWSLTIKTRWSTTIRITLSVLLNIDATSANSLLYYTVHSLIRFIRELYYHSCNLRYQLFQNWEWKPSSLSTIIYWTAVRYSSSKHSLFFTTVLTFDIAIAQCWEKKNKITLSDLIRIILDLHAILRVVAHFLFPCSHFSHYTIVYFNFLSKGRLSLTSGNFHLSLYLLFSKT